MTLTETDYDYFYRQVYRKIKWADGDWFHVGRALTKSIK